MKAFLTKLLVLGLVFYGLLFALQWLVDSGLRKTYDDTYADWNLLFAGKINTPLVFLGSSRAEAHFDTKLIEQQTGISGYNLGMPALSLQMQTLRWKSYLTHNSKPQIVVQNIDLFALSEKALPDKKQFLPYYDQPELYNELVQFDSTALLEKWVPMSKYRGFESQVLQGLGGWFAKKYTRKKVNGYRTHNEQWNHDFEHYKQTLHGKPVDFSKTDFSKGFAALDTLVAQCRQKNIRLVLVWAPVYQELSALQQPTLNRIKAKVREKARAQNILFWDFSNDPINADKRYFYNSFHMNDKGVAVFCREFSDSLNAAIKDDKILSENRSALAIAAASFYGAQRNKK